MEHSRKLQKPHYFERYLRNCQFVKQLSKQLQLLVEGFCVMLIKIANKDSWKLFLEQPNVKNFARQFNDFHTNIQITELGDSAEFWVQYTNHVKTYA